MMFILSILPLALGMIVVIMALIRKLKPQAVSEKAEIRPENGDAPESIGRDLPRGEIILPEMMNYRKNGQEFYRPGREKVNEVFMDAKEPTKCRKL